MSSPHGQGQAATTQKRYRTERVLSQQIAGENVTSESAGTRPSSKVIKLEVGLDAETSSVVGEGTPQNEATEQSGIERVADLVAGAKKIVALVGAGISTSSGIPDFRSSKGIYELAGEMDLGLPQPECLFDLEYFADDPAPFYKFAHMLYPEEQVPPSPTHQFLHALERASKLRRLYTQNIDGLEARTGMKRIVQCHGTLNQAKCMRCKSKSNSKDSLSCAVKMRTVAHCVKPKCNGVLKPCVTFFGEPVGTTVEKRVSADLEVCDLVLVLGTSLQVAPMSSVLERAPASVPCILINRDSVKPRTSHSRRFDVELLGECDAICLHLFDAVVKKVGPRRGATLRKLLPPAQREVTWKKMESDVQKYQVITKVGKGEM
mmetsp:Transcript_1099/g.1654  ORF Transcript_1099/g.1654 Transcript_1099/m.1654 type:complete len:376 (-) Transcript_1099:1575-2702(-)